MVNWEDHHHIGTTAVLAALTVLATGCSSAANQPAGAGPEKTSIVVGAVPAVDTAGLYIAEQRHYFAAAGLQVKIVPIISSERAISTQLAGGYDITFGNYVSYIQADAERHADLRIIAEGSVMRPGEQGLLTLPSSRITTLTGLKGMTIAVNVLNNVGTILIGSALEANGLSPSQVRFVPVNFPQMAAALQGHQVDAAWMPEPFVSSAEEQVSLRDISDLDTGSVTSFPLVGYAVTRSWEQRYPKTAAAFLRALEEGQSVAAASRPAVEQAMETFLGMSPQIASVMTLPAFPLGVDPVRLQRVADAMRRFGFLSRPFNVAAIIG
jgi:NitT/TauT family transport system substrate-binding protein